MSTGDKRTDFSVSDSCLCHKDKWHLHCFLSVFIVVKYFGRSLF